MHFPPWAIWLGAVIVIGLVILLVVKAGQNSTLYRSVTPHSEGVEHTEGGWRELMQRRNARLSKMGLLAFSVVAIFACAMLTMAEPAQKVQAALWPTATTTASVTPRPTRTRTPKPTLRYTLTPRYSPTPSATQTPLVTPTARTIYQNSVVTQIVRVNVQQTVLVPVTVIVFQTVIVTPTETPTATDTPTATATETPTETPTP